jgi:hypothetical protein
MRKLNCYAGGDGWSLGFAGAGDGAVVDDAERHLANWLKCHKMFTKDQLIDAIDAIVRETYKTRIDPDPNAEGISLVVGASCADGLLLVQTVGRTPRTHDTFTCAGVGESAAFYLLDRLYNAHDNWLKSAKIAAFVLHEARKSVAYCGGNSNFIVLQKPPHPRWRDLGDDFGLEVDGDFEGMLGKYLRPKIIKGRWRPELMAGYCDERDPEAREESDFLDDPKSLARLKTIVEQFEREDESL